MKKFDGLKVCIWCLLLTVFGCQNITPKNIDLPDYPDLKEVYTSQYKLLGSKELKETILLDRQTESKTLSMDSLKWKEELSFFKEMNPNQPEYVGVYKTVVNEGE